MQKIANFLNTDHELYLKSDEAQKFIPDIPKYFDEPFADLSQIPTYLISRMAVNKVKVISGVMERTIHGIQQILLLRI